MDAELAKRRERIAALRNTTAVKDSEGSQQAPQPSLLSGTTVESMAAWLLEEAQTLGKVEIKAGQDIPVEHFNTKPNADLRREWERRSKPLVRQTEKAINHLIRERLSKD